MGTPHQRLTSSDALFSKTQQAVLGLLFTHVDESFHLREIVRRIPPGTVIAGTHYSSWLVKLPGLDG